MLQNRVTLVTGAGRGIGRAVSLALGEQGARVAVTSRSRDQLEKLVGEITAVGGEAIAIVDDLTDRAAPSRIVDQVIERWGPVEILVNNEQYGGGGIYNFQATAAADTGFAEYIFVHEFGHHFAGLADEYYTSDVAYETGAAYHPEPWEPNVTALHDPEKLKWKELVESGTPLPTPWNKSDFEASANAAQAERRLLRERGARETEMNRLFTEQAERETALLQAMPNAGKVGAFEGASYEPTGLYRPEVDCIMFTRNPVGFCRVCRRAINQVIDQYARL